jgi:hypothetical protein
MPSLDLFATRAMTEAVLQMKPTQTFFLDRFFKAPPKTHASATIDVDIYKNKRKVAPYTRSGNKSVNLQRVPFATQPMSIPYIKLSRNLEAVLLALRMPGEHIYSSRSQADRAREILAQDLNDLNDAITRAEELQAAQAIVLGKATMKGEEVNAEADYQRSAGNTYTVGTLWGAGGSDPGADLRAANLKIQQSTGMTADVVLMGQTALNAFLKNALVLQQLDTLHGDFGSVAANQIQYPGATYYGMFNGFQIWTYVEWYLDDATDTEIPLIPDDKVIITSTAARNIRHYGPIVDLGSLIPERRFAKSWEIPDPSARMLALHSAPLMVPHDIDATVNIKVV